MSDKVYELYKENELDKKFIEDAFSIMLDKDKELVPYISDFRVIDDINYPLGSYSNEDRWIKINKGLIEALPIESKILALKTIRKELEHARSLKSLYDGRRDIESLINYYSLRGYAIKNGMDINIERLNPTFLEIDSRINIETNPAERLAEIKAWKYMVNLLKNQRTTDDLLCARTMLYYSYTRGYNDNRYYLDAPTMTFLLKSGMFFQYNLLKNRIDKKDYSFDTRLTYGLPLTYPEYDKDILKKVKLKKKRID